MSILYIALKHVTWRFRIFNYFREIFRFHDFMSILINLAKSVFAHILESDSSERRRAKTGPLVESPPGPLLKSGLQPLGRYGTIQETISRRPELDVCSI